METKSFFDFIDNAAQKGAEKIDIIRSSCYCGIVKPGDIISVTATKNGNLYRVSLQRVFDQRPVIACSVNGGDTIKEFFYKHE